MIRRYALAALAVALLLALPGGATETTFRRSGTVGTPYPFAGAQVEVGGSNVIRPQVEALSAPKSYTISGTTDGSGDATVFTAAAVSGRVVAVSLDIDALDATADTTVTTETVGQTVLAVADTNTNVVKRPAAQVHDAADGTNLAATFDYVRVADERVKVVVAQGGATAAFSVVVVLE